MDSLDSKIQQALRQTGSDFANITDEASAYQEVMSTFQGSFRIMMILGAVKLIATEILFFYACYAFFQQTTVMAMLAWASIAIICIMVTCAIIIIFYVQMNKNAINRDIKRLELQIALLIKQQGETKA